MNDWLDWPTEAGLHAAFHPNRDPSRRYVLASRPYWADRQFVYLFGTDAVIHPVEGWRFKKLDCPLPEAPVK